MKGGSISLPRRLRNLDGHGPVGVLVPPATCGLEVQLLQTLDDGTYAARPDGPVVHLDDGRDLEPRTGEEHLIGGVELRPVHVALHYGHPKLFLRELHHGVAGYALQYVRRNRRRDERALPHEEDVGRAGLRDLPILSQEDGVVVAAPVGLVDREGRVDVGARALGPRRDGIVRRAPPGGDADLQAGELHVVAHGDREGGELRMPQEVHTHRLHGLERQRPYIGVHAWGVAAQDLQRDVAELVHAHGQVDVQQAAGLLEALVVLAQHEDLQRAPLLAPVRPDALEDARAVVQGVGGRGEAYLAQPDHLASVVGPIGVRRRECFTTHRFSLPARPAGVSIPSAASARNSCPTFSTCDSASLRRIARKLEPPAWFSSTQSLAHLPLWMSVRMVRILSLAASSMIFGPAV